MKKTASGVAHLMSAIKFSCAGFRVAIVETAVRQELLLGVVHFVALYFLDVGCLFGIVLSALWGIVLIVEIVNTAIEKVVDLVSPDYNLLAARAKDLGSAAVFLSLLVFLGSWTVVILRIFIGEGACS